MNIHLQSWKHVAFIWYEQPQKHDRLLNRLKLHRQRPHSLGTSRGLFAAFNFIKQFYFCKIDNKTIYSFTVSQTSLGTTTTQTHLKYTYPSTQQSELWPVCVWYLPKNPCGQDRPGCSSADWGVVISNRFPAQKRGNRGVKRKKSRGRRAVWWGADGGVSVWPGGKSNLSAKLGSRQTLPSLSPFSRAWWGGAM